MAPADLIAAKVMACHQRQGQPKSGTDWRDVAMLLLAFPELKRERSPVFDCMKAAGAARGALTLWKQFATQEIRPADEDEAY